MARYTGGACRQCRRVSEKLMLKGSRCFGPKCAVEHRGSTPGRKSGSQPPRKMSNRGIQLREKQKARYTYGVLERQFRRFFSEADRMAGITGENLLVMLERRLDNVCYRLGFGNSRVQSRQLVRHGHIIVNGHKTDIPSFLVKPGDIVEWREGSRKTEYFKVISETVKDVTTPAWLNLDKSNMSGKVLSLPSRQDVEIKVDDQAIVEYYSR